MKRLYSPASPNLPPSRLAALISLGATALMAMALLVTFLSAIPAARAGGPWYVDATVAYNSDGAIANYATVMLQNSILAHNGDRNCWSDLTSLRHNLEDGDDCDLTAAGDLLGTDPLLRPLAANGGGMQTHALHAGSPAIDTADDDACPAIDQRGVARPLDGDEDGAAHCDIGALEMEVTPQGYTLNCRSSCATARLHGSACSLVCVATATLVRAARGSNLSSPYSCPCDRLP